MGCGRASWALGTPEVVVAVVAVSAINGLFSCWQEYEAERAAEALQHLRPHQVSMRRAGREKTIHAREINSGAKCL